MLVLLIILVLFAGVGYTMMSSGCSKEKELIKKMVKCQVPDYDQMSEKEQKDTYDMTLAMLKMAGGENITFDDNECLEKQILEAMHESGAKQGLKIKYGEFLELMEGQVDIMCAEADMAKNSEHMSANRKKQLHTNFLVI